MEYDIRIVGLDLDGTLFDDNKVISQRSLNAIAAAAQKGVYVLPATGRPSTGVPEGLLNIPGIRYALTSNGASVVDLQTGERLVEQAFDLDTALKIYDALIQRDCLADVFIAGQGYTLPSSMSRMDEFAPWQILDYIKSSRAVAEDLVALMCAHPDEIEKFSILYRDMDTRTQAWAEIEALFPGCEVASSYPNNMEISAPGVDKGSGLLALARHLGLKPENIMACGDSGNDLAMIRQAGHGVAMGNSQPEILAAADVVTDDNNHDGVAKAIEKYVLGWEVSD